MFLEKFKYILAYLDVYYIILITLFVIVSLFPLFLFFSQNSRHAGQNILKTVQAIHFKFSGIL